MYDITFPLCNRTGQEKSLQELIQPDERIKRYKGLTPEDVQSCFLEAEQKLSNNVPKEVRERLSIARILGTYGYFQCEFFTVSLFWSLTAIEMALRQKFNNFKKPFRYLTNLAVKNGLIPSGIKINLQELKNLWQSFPDADRSKFTYTNAQIIAKEIPELRNMLAHPGAFNTILIPRSAIDGYRQAIEIINSLWP